MMNAKFQSFAFVLALSTLFSLSAVASTVAPVSAEQAAKVVQWLQSSPFILAGENVPAVRVAHCEEGRAHVIADDVAAFEYCAEIVADSEFTQDNLREAFPVGTRLNGVLVAVTLAAK